MQITLTVMKLRANTIAGLLYLLPVFAVFFIWWALIFVGVSSPLETLRFALLDGPNPHWFWWLLVFPALCLALSIAYLSELAVSQAGASWFFVLGAGLAVAAWLTFSSEIALFATLPLLYGFGNLRGAWRSHENHG